MASGRPSYEMWYPRTSTPKIYIPQTCAAPRADKAAAAGAFSPRTPALMVMAAQVGAALCLAPSTLHRGAPAAARGRGGKCCRRGHSFPVLRIVTCKAKDSESGSAGGGAAETAAVVGGLAANPVVGFSLYTLKTTGCGLPPGPGGLLGGLEGVSYLAVASIVVWSLYTKAKTGSGLPNGPFGLLGAVEGVSFLSVLAILVVFGLQFLDRGFIPGPLPSDQCFG